MLFQTIKSFSSKYKSKLLDKFKNKEYNLLKYIVNTSTIKCVCAILVWKKDRQLLGF